MPCRDPYGYALTTSPAAAAAYSRGLLDMLRLKSGALPSLAASIAHDPTFALGHASLALLGHELCANVDIGARLQDAVHTLTRRQPPGWTGYARRIDDQMLTEVLEPLGPATRAYACGPTALVETVANSLVGLGLPPDRIRTERFGPTGT